MPALSALIPARSGRSGGASGEHKGTDEADQPNSPNADASIEEQICFEHEGVQVTAKSMTNNSIRGTGINLLVENDTERDYFVSARHIIVNNCMVSTLFSCEVAAGKKANDTLYLSSSALKAAGIGNIGRLNYISMFTTAQPMKRCMTPNALH